MNRTVALAALLLAAPLSGCALMDDVEPVWEIDPEDHLIVMPFKDPDFPDRWEGNPRGHDTARLTTEALQQNAEFGVRPYESIYELFLSADMTKLSPREVAALCKADYVLVCDFDQLQLSDPKNINMKQGTARVRVRLFEVQRRTPQEEEKAARQAEEQRLARERAGMPPIEYDRGGRYIPDAERVVEARFPSDFMNPGGELFLESADIEENLLAAVARKVARLYYAHKAEKIERD